MEALVSASEFDYSTLPLDFYCLYDPNELSNDVKHKNDKFPIIGLGDFLFFDSNKSIYSMWLYNYRTT